MPARRPWQKRTKQEASVVSLLYFAHMRKYFSLLATTQAAEFRIGADANETMGSLQELNHNNPGTIR